MAIETQRSGNSVIVSLSGRLDGVTSPDYGKTARELLDGGATRIVVDCDKLDYISSVGLGELILTAKLLKERNGQFSVANVRGNVLSVFEMCGIGSMVAIHPTVAAALAAFA